MKNGKELHCDYGRNGWKVSSVLRRQVTEGFARYGKNLSFSLSLMKSLEHFHQRKDIGTISDRFNLLCRW